MPWGFIALRVAFAIDNDAHLVARPQRCHVGNLAELARLELGNIVLDGKLSVLWLRARSKPEPIVTNIEALLGIENIRKGDVQVGRATID